MRTIEEHRASKALRVSIGLRRKSFPSSSSKSNAESTALVVIFESLASAAADQIEHRKPVLVAVTEAFARKTCPPATNMENIEGLRKASWKGYIGPIKP